MAYAAKSFDIDLLSEENVKKYVLPKYNLQTADICQIKFKNTEKQRAVYKVTYGNNCYCLKKVYYDESDLLFVYSAVEWFYRNEIRVPRILPACDGNRFVNYNNMFFILTPWIQGEKCDYDRTEHIIYSIENLGRMHVSVENFVPIKGSRVKEKKDSIYRSHEKHFFHLLNCSNYAFKEKDKFSDFFLKNFEKNILLARTSVDIAHSINNKNLHRCLCHLDYVNKNIILSPNNDIWVIDFDKCAIDYRVHDIGYFLRRLLRRKNTNWDATLAAEILEYYDKFIPLNLDEYRYILSYLSFPQKFWKISRDYYKNINKCNKKSFQKILKSSVEDIDNQSEFVYLFGKHIESKFGKDLIY
ncbi:CotS family spore coat protein [Clostridium botulinum]|uniref:Spore coat protein homolog n=1 Tax=Clostridium botulinum (strain Okra / Type B1) TaxID=498213 RepID=B1ILK5_CLOBK|nr:CotS family spore coat protein [Clostridium botulinum]ACA45016.1 spore coat protein homolog [Clostridium botulinum B1 str. Okra]MBD5563079.1 CotS family spore coat protein [Clostridium botulinum]MBD5567660.1 CotS family spore coat protein [Clostridium botulinum]MBD5571839.1 CotS family spore coat protein [Clostridium botulinum]MBD5574291.1 CotS family spore coat protein [Clostridium botulinum]